MNAPDASRRKIVFDAKTRNDRDFWIEHLAGSERAGLPLARPRSRVVTTERRQEVELRLDASIGDTLQRWTDGSPALLYTALAAALGVVLRRYGASRRPVLGSPPTERLGPPGPTDDWVPVVLDVDLRHGFRDVLRTTRQAVRDAYAHQGYPLDRLAEETGRDQEAARPSFFDITLALDDLHFAHLPDEAPELRADLRVRFALRDGDLVGTLAFDGRLLSRDTVEVFARHFERLLAAAVADGDRPVESLPLLGPEEERRVLEERNATDAEAPPVDRVEAWVTATMERVPDRIAVIHEGAYLSYGALGRRGAAWATALAARGVGPESRVGVALRRSLEMPVAVLGILAAGGAYVPLDPSYPAERLRFMGRDAGLDLVVTDVDSDSLSTAAEQRLAPGDVDTGSAPRTWPPAPGGQAAYVIYTSGSTGRPKGVVQEHRALTHLLAWQGRRSRLPDGARTLQLTSLSFDVSFQEIFATWASGGTLVVASEKVRRNLAALPRFLEDEDVERLFIPFVALQQLAELATATGDEPKTVREIVTAGEQLQVTPALVRFFREIPQASLDNQYGPTEAHVVSAHLLEGFAGRWPQLPPIGTPIDHARLYVLDGTLRPVPDGVAGELYVAGPCVARGYHHRPGRTARAFRPDPFGETPGGRIYRTGDQARWSGDGLEFLGRSDDQVKIRGHRVEPGEVEAALAAHPGIRAAVVLALGDGAADRHLVACLRLAEGTEGSEGSVAEQELQDHLRSRVPDPLVPSAFHVFEELPRTPSGKVDRRALTQEVESRIEAARKEAFVAPRTPTETALAEIWSDVLGVEAVGVENHFFDLGGHSLLGARMLARVRTELGVEVPLRRLFENPTLEALATVVDHLRERDAEMGDALVAEQEEELASLVAEIESLSDEETERLLEVEGVGEPEESVS